LSSLKINEQLGDIYEDNAASLFEFFLFLQHFIQIVKEWEQIGLLAFTRRNI
jgi:hypothetical protein